MNSRSVGKYLHTVLLLFFATLPLGCAGSGTNFSSQYVRQIQIGKTTNAEIMQNLGMPHQSVVSMDLPGVHIDRYFYRRFGGNSDKTTRKRLTLEFVNDTVNGFIYENSWDEQSTDFDEKKAERLVVNKTTRAETIAALGDRSGELVCPSWLIQNYYDEWDLEEFPRVYKRAITYRYDYLIESLSGSTFHGKHAILFFDDKDVLIYKRVDIYPESTAGKLETPFSPSTAITYNTAREQHVMVVLFDTEGDPVDTLVNTTQPPGKHTLTPAFGKYPSGVYVYQLTSGDTSYTKKIVLVK